MEIARLLIMLYGALCVVALWFIPARAHVWLGVELAPLSAVYAMLLALPWALLLHFVPEVGPWAAAAAGRMMCPKLFSTSPGTLVYEARRRALRG